MFLSFSVSLRVGQFRAGKDVTIVSYGRGVAVTMEAVPELEKLGIDAEVQLQLQLYFTLATTAAPTDTYPGTGTRTDTDTGADIAAVTAALMRPQTHVPAGHQSSHPSPYGRSSHRRVRYVVSVLPVCVIYIIFDVSPAVKKTNRIVSVEECWPQSGIGAEISALMMECTLLPILLAHCICLPISLSQTPSTTSTRLLSA